MTTQSVIVEREGAVAQLTMNRPDVLNVLDEDLAEQLSEALIETGRDRSVRAVLLRGAGRSFMAGGDLSRFREDLDGAPATASGLISRFHGIVRAIAAMPKPVIAAIQGPVAGGGVGLALACDLVIASADCTLLSAYTKLGTSPDGGTTWSLTRLLGPKRALAFMLLNDRIDAETALRLGLVNAVVPATDLLVAASGMADRLAAGSVGAGAAVKRLVREAAIGGLDAQLDLERDGFTQSAGTADFREGVTAFFERRAPRFTD